MTKTFYFRKSFNGNADVYKLNYATAMELYDKVFNDKKLFLEKLKFTGTDINDLYAKLEQNFYQRCQRAANIARHQYWHQSTDYIYTFDNNNIRNFKQWQDIYENTVLPNYAETEYSRLDELTRNYHSEPTTSRVSIYQHMITLISEERDDDYEIKRECRSQQSALFLLDLLLKNEPSKHISHLVTIFKDNLKTKAANDNYYSNATIKLNETATPTVNKLAKDLLIAASGTSMWNLPHTLLERVDDYDHTMIDKLAEYLNIKVAPYITDHRDSFYEVN